MNLNQLRKEKEQLKTRIASLKQKLDSLETQETELENSEILKTVRSLKLKSSELDGLLTRLKRNPFQEVKEFPSWEPEKDEN